VSAPEPVTPEAVHPRTIVVPLDGSDVADAALPVAHHLAAAFRAEVQRIIVRDGKQPSGRRRARRGPGQGDRRARRHARRAPGRAVGPRAQRLDEAAGRQRRGAGRAHLDAPVVVVGPNLDRSQPLLAPRSLLVAVGRHPVPPSLIPAAVGWAAALRASMTLAHVISPEVADVLERRGGGTTLTPDLEALAEQADGSASST
jgi:hypothetical protein